MRIVHYDGDTSLVEVYLAPGEVSPNVVERLAQKFELMLADFGPVNTFLKEIVLREDYFAIIAIETEDFDEVLSVAEVVEGKTKEVASRMKSSITSAIGQL